MHCSINKTEIIGTVRETLFPERLMESDIPPNGSWILFALSDDHLIIEEEQGGNSIEFKNITKIIITKIITKNTTSFLSTNYNKKIKKLDKLNSLYISPFQIGLSRGFS